MALLYDLRTHRYDVFKAGNYAAITVGAGYIRLSEANDFCRPLSGRFSGQQVERLVMRAGTRDFRFLMTGQIPASGTGLYLEVNGVLILDGYEDIVNLIISREEVSGVLQILSFQYFYPA